MDIVVTNIPITLMGDILHNTQGRADTDGVEYDDAWYAGISINKLKNTGDWHIKYLYASLDQDATPAGINDKDFGHTNRRGHKFTLKYMFAKNTYLGATYHIISPIRRNPFGVDIPDRDIIHIDLATKF